MITGFILAGGQSSRMGYDKAFLSVGGRMMIEHVIARVLPHVDRLVAIGNKRNGDRLQELGLDGVITDIQPGMGPLMGVYTGLLHTETPLNLFVSCDMPWINGRVIKRLIAASAGGSQVVASRGPDGRLYPLPMLCHVRFGRTVGKLLNSGERSLNQLLQFVDTGLVPLDAVTLRSAFTNVNTLADYVKEVAA